MKILEDIYNKLKRHWWGIPLILLASLYLIVLSMWNSLPDSTKEKILISYYQLQIDIMNKKSPSVETLSVRFIGVDDKGKCFLNGEQVASAILTNSPTEVGYKTDAEGGRETIDLTSRLRLGKNILRCEVRNSRNLTCWAYDILVEKDNVPYRTWSNSCCGDEVCKVEPNAVVFSNSIALYKNN